jgi:hypothetical protein
MSIKVGAKHYIKYFVKSREILYVPFRWFGVITYGEMTKQETSLCIEGFGSSGNSYAYQVFDILTKGHVSHHTHTIANVKKSMRINVPVVILFRDPFESIPSHVVRFDKPIYEDVKEYERFYKDVMSIKSDLVLVNFKDLIQNTLYVVDKVAKVCDLNIDRPDSREDIEKEAQRRIQSWAREEGSMSNIPLPDKERDMKKRNIKSRLMQKSCVKKLKNIFESLNEHKMEI